MDQRNKWREILGELNASAMSKTENALVKAYRNAIKDIKVQAKGFIEEYDTLSFSKRIEVERLLSVGQEIQAILEGTNKIVTQTIAQGTGNMAKNGYYSTFYGMEGEYSLNIPMGFLGEDYIQSVVNSPVNGQLFSQRIHRNTDKLARVTTQSLIQGAIDGKGYKYVAKRIEDLTEADYKKALRIARTEGGRASSLSQQKAYEEAQSVGVKLKKRWLSTLDEATRNSHRLLDGQTVEAEEAFVSPETGAIGQGPRLMGRASEDINCRCTTIAVVDGYEPELRLDNETGETIKNMSYTEWEKMKNVPKTNPVMTIPPKVATVVREYTEGNYRFINEYSRLKATGKVNNPDNLTRFLGPITPSVTDEFVRADIKKGGFSAKLKAELAGENVYDVSKLNSLIEKNRGKIDDAEALYDFIVKQPLREISANRIELSNVNELSKLTPGSPVDIGILSFSKDMSFTKKVVSALDEGVTIGADVKTVVSWHIDKQATQFLDVSMLSNFDQEEILMTGKFIVTDVITEEVENGRYNKRRTGMSAYANMNKTINIINIFIKPR